MLAAAWSLCLVLIVAAAALAVVGLQTVSTVVVPLAVAVLLTVLLEPLARWLTRTTPLPHGVSSLVALLVLILVVSGGFALVGTQITAGLPDMRASVNEGLNQVSTWLRDGPLNLTGDQLSNAVQQARSWVTSNSGALSSGAMSVGTTAAHFAAGLLIALIATYFFLAQGARIWAFFLQMIPGAARAPLHEASRRGWRSLGSYARTQVLVAAIDAAGIGIGAAILGLPFLAPLIVLVFLASFIPIIGAFVSGAVAVLIALVVHGPSTAIIMLLIVLAVQQVESHVLQPFIMGKAVSLHPLAVIVAVAVGSFLLGVVGALFAVPVLAFVNTALHYLAGRDPFPEMGSESTAATEAESQAGPAPGRDAR